MDHSRRFPSSYRDGRSPSPPPRRFRSPSPRRPGSPPPRRPYCSPSPPRGEIDSYTPLSSTRRRISRSPPPRSDSYVPRGGGSWRRPRSRSPLRRRSRSPLPRQRLRSRSLDRRRRYSRSRTPPFRRLRSRTPPRNDLSPRRRRSRELTFVRRRDSRSPTPERRQFPSRSPPRRPRSKSPLRTTLYTRSDSRPPAKRAPDSRAGSLPRKRERTQTPPPKKSESIISPASSRIPRRLSPSSRSSRRSRSRGHSPVRTDRTRPRSSYRSRSGSRQIPLSRDRAILTSSRPGRSPPRARSPPLRSPRSPRENTSPIRSSIQTEAKPSTRPAPRSPPRGPRLDRSPVRLSNSRDKSPQTTSRKDISDVRMRSPSLKVTAIKQTTDDAPASRPRSPPKGPSADLRRTSPPRRPRSPFRPSQNPLLAPRGPASMMNHQRESFSRQAPMLSPRPVNSPPATPQVIKPGTSSSSSAPTSTINPFSQPGVAPPTGPRNMPVPTGPRAGHRSSNFASNNNPSTNNMTNGTTNHHNNSNNSVSTSSSQTRSNGVISSVLNNGPLLVPGGRLLPPISAELGERLSRLKIDQIRIDEENEAVQTRKRKMLIEWQKLERELASQAVRVELAEKHLINSGFTM